MNMGRHILQGDIRVVVAADKFFRPVDDSLFLLLIHIQKAFSDSLMTSVRVFQYSFRLRQLFRREEPLMILLGETGISASSYIL